ncbi:hypothetical protein J3B02_006496 [Coemansia erecta]|uniref:S-adenosyl-L-methionine-dependent methyltransferase n=1 Tax=Coemansia asiatica TaxID=1052880 RepID=A0A9W7XML1_9FUNG|nr:hypothetical protein LPJ64_002667 [Coemansia asiatica]KAJ2836448.1 hypothetical protein J3B02_006496 [Coemansia erecta]KAJ2857453.1 hypothetical protein FB639_005997 [Coemansia asiatica]
MAKPSPSSSSSPSSSPLSSSSDTPVQTRREVPPEPYPWKRVTLGVFLVFLCWTIGLYRENKAKADEKILNLQHWGFNHLWSHLSAGNSQRVNPLRQPLWNRIHGTVLEIGPGFGESLALVPGGRKGTKVVRKYVVLEPNHYMHGKLAKNAAAAGFNVLYDSNTCTHAPVADDSLLPSLVIVNGTLDSRDKIPTAVVETGPFDCVVSSLVLCSVADLEQNLANIQRLLKPGGMFIFLEHVRHLDDVRGWQWIQDWITPVWTVVAGNCRLDRETGSALDSMEGWAKVEYQRVWQQDGVIDKLTPMIYGVAVKK